MRDLKQRCRQYVRELASEEGWPLPPAGLERLVEEILPYVEQLEAPSRKDVWKIAAHYRRDGPMVRAMRTASSPDGERLWQGWRAFFLRLAANRGVFGEDAEELAQAACERALRGLNGFGFRSGLKTWLTSTFVNCYRSWLRNKQALKRGGAANGRAITRVSLDAEGGRRLVERVEGAAPSPEQHYARTEFRQLLDRELERLLQDEDVLILRRYYVEKEYPDPGTGQPRRWTDEAIGRALGLSRNTVTSRRRRALARLREDPAIRALARDILGIEAECSFPAVS